MTYIYPLMTAILAGLISYILAIQKTKDDIKVQIGRFKLERSKYISERQFDQEFEIYKELSEKFLSMFVNNGRLFPPGLIHTPLDKKERDELDKKHYFDACKAYDDANLSLLKYAPFISEALFDEFSLIAKNARYQIDWFFELRIKHYPNREILNDKTFQDVETNCYKLTTDLNNQRDRIITSLREHFIKMRSGEAD